MSRQVFFSFDFSEDLWRASVVRNRWITDTRQASDGFWDPMFTAGSSPGRDAMERFVDVHVEAAEVTAVLVGAHTARQHHVLYAISRSVELGRGLLGIQIDRCKNRYGNTSTRGPNPFEAVIVRRDGRDEPLSDIVPTYDWVGDDGFRHLDDWIAEAMARTVARR